MKHESFKKLGSRVTALLLAVLLLMQAVPIMPAKAAEVPDTGKVTVEPAGSGTVLPDYIFSDAWNAEYDVLYHLADEKYTHDGQLVSFPDEATVKVGETSYPIKNAVTSVSAVMENGQPVVTFQNLKTPVGSISGEWNSGYAGTFAIHGKVNGQTVTPVDVDRISNVKLVVEAPVSGSYTFTDGRIYEAANEYSGGHDFGDGVVTNREFGYLPEVTVTVELPSTPPAPPEPPAPPTIEAPFTAKIGDRVLAIEDGGKEYCGKQYADVQIYTVVIPEDETSGTFTLYGEGLAYIKGGGCSDRTWDIEGSVELDILEGETYHLRKGWTETFHIAFRKEGGTVPTPPEPPVPPTPPTPPAPPTIEAPFTAKIGDRVLAIEDGGKEYCGKQYADVQIYTVVIPEDETSGTFTLYGEGLAYIKGGGCSDRTWDIEGSVELDILEGKTYHLRKGWTETFHIAFRKEDGSTPTPPDPEVPPVEPGKPTKDAPFTAKIGENQLVIEEGVPVYCNAAGREVPYYIVVLPKGETAQSVSVTGELSAYSVGEDGEEQNCSGAAELPVLKGQVYHVFQTFRPFPVPHADYYHIAFRYDDGASKIPEITAKIGDRTLEVAEVTMPAYPCSATHTYEIKVPDTLKDQLVTIDGLKDYTYRAVNSDKTCDGNLEAWKGSAAIHEFGYHFYAEQGYKPEYQNIHVVFSLFHEEAPKAPIQAMLGQQELQIDVIPPETEYGPTGLVIHVPSPFTKSVTLHGVKGWMYMNKNQEMGQMFSIETNTWEAEVLKPGEFFMLDNWPEKYRVTFQIGDAAEANILLNAQMDGTFLLPPETKGQIAPGLAKTLGYAYGEGITETDVTALDALVKMHQIKYPGEDVKQYLALNEQGFITKVFGVETGAVGFMVNGTMPNTAIHATPLSEGDTVDFFNFQDTTSWSDKIVWLEQNGQKKTRFDAAAGVPLTLTVKTADYSGKVTPVSGVQLATVDADGKITPMEGVTDRNGSVSVTFPQAEDYTITVISSAETKVVMPVAHVAVSGDAVILSVEARAAGKGDFLSATAFALEPDASQTVKDLLDIAAKQFDLDVVYTENGGLQSINGLTSSDGGWRYFVNGEAATESISQRKAAPGDVIRIRFAVTAAADELDAPLYQYLKKLVDEAKDLLTFAYTADSKEPLQAAVAAADEVLSDPANNSFDDDKELLLSQHIAAINEGIAQLVPEEAAKDPSIPDDFENDLWLQYDYKEMKVGETASIYPRRVPQIISDPIQNIVTRPVFRFEIVKGDSITLSENATREKTQVTAVREGVSIVKVTYDAEGEFGACSPINEAYAVFNVGSSGTLQISTSLSQIRSYDTIYYTGTDTVAYPFTVSVPGAAKVEVTCNDLPVAANGDGTYTANLENRSNVLGITATDAQGDVTRYYRVVDARKIQVIVDNKTSPGQPFKINDTARVSFRGITMPVYKLATIYNPCFREENPVTHVTYQNEQLGELTGYCNQYDIATKNSFEITFTEAGDYHFTDGRIFCAWWGDDLGSDKIKEGSGKPGFGAPIVQDIFSWMPDFTIHVANEFSDNVPVTGIQLNRTELTLSEGESFQLTATVQPDNATNRNFVWSCDDPTGFFLTLDKNTGKITANNACTAEQPVVTVTATTEDGAKAASCKVVVKAVPHEITVENGTADPSSAARKTVVTIRANQAPAGKKFDHWEVIRGTIYLTNSNQAETTFVMPDTDVALKAVYTTVKTPDRDPGGESHSFSDKSEKDTKQESNMVDAEIVDGMVSAEALAEIQGKDKNLRMTGKLEDGREFTWIINGKDIQKVAALKFGMSRKGRFEEDIHKLAEEPEIFRFLEDGSFPGSMLVEMPTDLEDGSYLLMRYNGAERRAEKVSKVEVTDGLFRFIAEEGGEYFLTKRASSKTVTELETGSAVPEETTAPTTVTAPTEENSTTAQKSNTSTIILVSVIVLFAVCLAAGIWFGFHHRKEKKHD